MLESESSPTLQKIESNTIIEYYDAEPHESSVKCPLCDQVQWLLGFLKRRGKRTERDATALKIDFYRDCYGYNIMTSTVRILCPLGHSCKHEAKARNEGQTNEKIKNKLCKAGVLTSVNKYSKVRGW